MAIPMYETFASREQENLSTTLNIKISGVEHFSRKCDSEFSPDANNKSLSTQTDFNIEKIQSFRVSGLFDSKFYIFMLL